MSISRRQILAAMSMTGGAAMMEQMFPSYARSTINYIEQHPQSLSGSSIDLNIADTPFQVGNHIGTAVTVNGTVPSPLIRLREGQDISLRVTNHLNVFSSIHWHGLLVPTDMDGVPGLSYAGIAPGTTFTYRFPIKQYGTYWYHSHSEGQEQAGMYGPIIIDPIETDPIKYDREYVVVLSDWSFSSMMKMIAKLKKQAGYYNFQQRTMGELFSNLREYGVRATLDNYLMWARMRMDPTDLLDVTGYTYTYLMNGHAPAVNWTALFRPGEKVRLRFIAAGAMTFFDVRIPGLKLKVVQADGQNVEPVEVDEFRCGPAETYDVIVEPTEDRAYTIFAEALDRSGYARGTLAPRGGMSAEIPARRLRPLRRMDDMGMSIQGHDMSKMKLEIEENNKAGGKAPEMNHDMSPSPQSSDSNKSDMPIDHSKHKIPDSKVNDMPMDHSQHQMKTPIAAGNESEIPGSSPVKHGPDKHGAGNQSTPDSTVSRLNDPGIGLGGEGRRVLVYTDLKALHPYPDQRQPERELELHATGNMERFMWSFDGKKFSQAPKPIHFRYGERLRWTFVNDTMMEHTFHLHGMWMYLENGAGKQLPRKHTVIVKPAERVSVLITPTERGLWAFHCHLLLHMETGMFRIVKVSDNAEGEHH